MLRSKLFFVLNYFYFSLHFKIEFPSGNGSLEPPKATEKLKHDLPEGEVPTLRSRDRNPIGLLLDKK